MVATGVMLATVGFNREPRKAAQRNTWYEYGTILMDTLTSEQRRRCMQANKQKGTTPELTVMKALRAAGLKFQKHVRGLPGTPDIVFKNRKLIVFIDGDFWHGFRFPAWKHTLPAYWRQKIERNRARDRSNFTKLRRAGWDVVRIWEHQVKADLEGVCQRVVNRGRVRGRVARRSKN